MAETVKITKKMYFEALKAMVSGVDKVGEIPADKVIEFIDTQVAQLDSKAAKASAKAAEKKANGDQLQADVLACVTADWQTGEQITVAVGQEDVSKSKVVARLTKLVNAESVVKDVQKIGDKKVTVYKLA